MRATAENMRRVMPALEVFAGLFSTSQVVDRFTGASGSFRASHSRPLSATMRLAVCRSRIIVY